MNHSPTTDWIDRWARFAPNSIAFDDADSGTQYTYAHASRVINHVANQFASNYQIQRGDRIAVVATNIMEYVFLLFIAQKLGAILVPINFRLTSREFNHILEDSKPKLLIYESQFADAVKEVGSESMARLVFEGRDSYQEMVHQTPVRVGTLKTRSEFKDACMILYTSGTTGAPKGAVLTNESIFWNSVNTSLRLNISQNDVTINFAPFFHTGGWNVLTTPFIHRGGTIVFLKKFDADQVLQIMEKRKVTIFFGVPTMLDMMAHSPVFSKVHLANVRYSVVGGEPMPLELIRTWQKKDIPIRQGYGLTEFGPNVFSLNEEDAIRKIGSIGFPNFYIDVKVENSVGDECTIGEIGELALRGPMCMREYWHNPDATAKTIKNGWLYTGDLVKFDEEGYFYVVGRKKEMYISGGENVYPAEVEQVIGELKGIREVAVIGVEDAKWGEVGKAFVVTEGASLTEATIQEYCVSNLAKFKVPKYFEFMAELPKGDSGKILKKQLR